MRSASALELLRLRLRMTQRTLVDLARAEPLPALAVLICLAGATWYLIDATRAGMGARKLAAAGIVLLMLLHRSRRDAHFLMLAGHVPRRIFAAEYSILLLPLAGLLALGAEPWLAPIVLLAGALVAAVPPERFSVAWAPGGGRHLTLIPVPVDSFEWISGLRRSLPGLLLLYVLAIPFSAIPAGPIALILAATVTTCGFYTEAEGWQMVQVFGHAPGRFLRTKVVHALRLWGIVMLPLIALFLARHPTLWPVLLIVLAGAAVVLTGSILVKYAAYREGRPLGAFGSLAPVVFAGAVLVPPVAAFLLFRLWRMATGNLRRYLHAFD